MALKDILTGLTKKAKYAQYARFLEGYSRFFPNSDRASTPLTSCKAAST